MRLADFILQNIEPLLAEWEKFTRTILPATRDQRLSVTSLGGVSIPVPRWPGS
jgi:hypothetical protein